MTTRARATLLLLNLLTIGFVGCSNHTGNKADATFFGGGDPVAFKIQLAKSEVFLALERLDAGQVLGNACSSELPEGVCGTHMDREACADLLSLRASPTLVSEALKLLQDSQHRQNLKNALENSRFIVVSELSAVGKHKVAMAPIGDLSQPIRYLGPALVDKESLFSIVFHEESHVAGLTDDQIRRGRTTHDVLTAAGTCLFNWIRNDQSLPQATPVATPAPTTTPTPSPIIQPMPTTTPTPSPEISVTPSPTPTITVTPSPTPVITPVVTPNPTPTPTPVPLPVMRDFTGYYNLYLQGYRLQLILLQDEDGNLDGEISGIPGIVSSARLVGAVYFPEGRDQEELSFIWQHSSSFASRFTGALSSDNLEGIATKANGTAAVNWSTTETDALFTEDFLSDLSHWKQIAGPSFSTADGMLTVDSSSFSEMVVNGINAKDGKVSAYLGSLSSNRSGDGVGFLARVSDNGKNALWVGLTTQNDGRLKPEIWFKDSGSWRKVYNSSSLSTTGAGLLVMEIRGQQIRLSLNGVEILSKSDNHLTSSGQFGVRANGLSGGLNTFRLEQ